MMQFRTLRTRILVLFLVLFVLVQALAFSGVNAAIMRKARAMIKDELVAGGSAFDRQLHARSERFFLAARVLSGDFGFKTAFGSRHKPTLLSAMRNHSARLNADVMLVVSLDHRVIADTLHPRAAAAKFPFPRLIKNAERSGSASGVIPIDDRLVQIVVFPLLAPSRVAWICLGSRIDDAMARELKKLTTLEVTFAHKNKNGLPVIAATTVDAAFREELAAVLQAAQQEPDGIVPFLLHGEQWLGLSRELITESDTHAKVFLQRSLDKALAPFDRLRTVQFLIFVCGLAAMLAGGVIISTSVTRRLRGLADGVKSIEQGNYQRPLPVSGEDELGKLSRAFNLMQEAIVHRQEQIRYYAYFDALTGLPNRISFQLRLGEALASAGSRRPVALLFMNIERFIDVIATLGHEAGDHILRQIGPLLRDATPASSVIARLNADAFAVLFPPGAAAEEAARIAQGIQKKLEAPIWIEEAPIQVEARFGIVEYPLHGTDADSLLRHADVAVHLAKASPSGITVYAPDLDHHSRRHLTLLGELRHAIDHKELMMYYQPKINVATGRIAGMEALIRWKHSRHGFVSPDEFIRLSEGTGLIKPVTTWTLEAAFSECAQLNRQGLQLNMAVNLSARVLQDAHLPDRIADLFTTHRLPADQITLEVTESAIMTDPQRTLEVITRLDATGAHLCVDDFGTGYSSLAYLQKLPVDELKIDKSFVQQMDRNENDAMIVHSVIELAHNLGLRVTAEGVENQKIWEMLKSRGCDQAQGYLHGKPMPLDELILWSKQSPWGLGG